MARAINPTISTTPQVVVNGEGGSASIPVSAVILNPTTATATVYVGGANLTSATTATNGFPLVAGASMNLDVVTEDIYAVTASGTQAISVMLLRG